MKGKTKSSETSPAVHRFFDSRHRVCRQLGIGVQNDDDVVVWHTFKSAIDLSAATRRTLDDLRTCDSRDLDRAVAAPSVAHDHP